MFGSMNTYTSMLDKSLEAEKISVSVIGENIVVVDDDSSMCQVLDHLVWLWPRD